MLAEVKIPDPEAVLGRYPHQLSGGQQQRIVIAMALIAEPALLIMDEPTTGLDVTVEAAVLDLVRDLRQRIDAAILFISHNLGTVVRVCDRIGVMYAGELVEEGTIRAVFANPRHPYTRGLLDCLPALGRDKRQAPLVPIPGQLDANARPPARLRVRAALRARRARAVRIRADSHRAGRRRPGAPRPVRPRRRAAARGAAGRATACAPKRAGAARRCWRSSACERSTRRAGGSWGGGADRPGAARRRPVGAAGRRPWRSSASRGAASRRSRAC